MRLTPSHALALLGGLLAAVFFVVPVGALDLETSRIAGLALLLVVLWATNALPPYLSVLLFFVLAMVFRVIPPDVAFSGFASGAFWLVFGGLVIGAAVRQTGLAARLANSLFSRFGSSYRGIIASVILLGVVLSFIVPSSMGRVVMLVPIAVALADRYQFAPGSRGRYGLILAMIYGAHNPSFGIMPANVPNMLLVGTIESVWGETVQYGSYLLLHFPVLGLLKALVIYGLILVLFHDTLPAEATDTPQKMPPMSAKEKRLALVMVAVLVLWALDFWHGIAPSWVALAGAVVLLLPGVGVLSQQEFNTGIRYSSLIFVAGVITLGTMIAQSDLSALIAEWAQQWLPLTPGADVLNYAALVVTAMLISVFGTIPTVPAVMVSLSDVLAQMSGLPLMSVLLIQVVGFSTILFPYQAPPLLVGAQLGDVPIGKAIRFTLLIALLTVALLLPLDFLWWRLLGWL